METPISVSELVDTMPLTIHHADLDEAWRNLAGSLALEPKRGIEMIVSVPRDLTLRQQELPDAAFGGAWEWNLRDGFTKTAVVSVLVAASLMAVGAGTGVAPVLIPAVVPFLFDVKKIRLERTADNYLRILGARSDVLQRRGTAKSLYDSLPQEARDTISKGELESFLNQAVDAGHAKANGGEFEVLPNGETAFRIAIR
jgi:hypothetical protein